MGAQKNEDVYCTCRLSKRQSLSTTTNSPIQVYVHPDDQTQPTFEMTPGFKPFTVIRNFL